MIARRSAVAGWWDALFPPQCCACGLVGSEPFCRICTEALLEDVWVSLLGFGRVRAMWEYGGPVQCAIQRMKYGRRIEIARALSTAISPSIFDPQLYDVLIPVPLSVARLRQRRFNPALELCRPASVPLDAWALRRQGTPRSQVGLGSMARRQNVDPAAFFVKTPERIRKKRVLLVDDVMTTGATLLAAGQALREAGAASVVGFVLARATSEGSNIEILDPIE